MFRIHSNPREKVCSQGSNRDGVRGMFHSVADRESILINRIGVLPSNSAHNEIYVIRLPVLDDIELGESNGIVLGRFVADFYLSLNH
jgi:hypothetical protein